MTVKWCWLFTVLTVSTTSLSLAPGIGFQITTKAKPIRCYQLIRYCRQGFIFSAENGIFNSLIHRYINWLAVRFAFWHICKLILISLAVLFRLIYAGPQRIAAVFDIIYPRIVFQCRSIKLCSKIRIAQMCLIFILYRKRWKQMLHRFTH